jgi:hypothetical protein
MRLAGVAVAIIGFFAWEIYKDHVKEHSPCALLVPRAEVERISGHAVEKIAGDVRAGSCTAGFFPLRAPLDRTEGLLTVEIDGPPLKLDDYERFAEIHGRYQKRPLADVDGAEVLAYESGATTVLAPVGNFVVRARFRNDVPRDAALAAFAAARDRLKRLPDELR